MGVKNRFELLLVSKFADRFNVLTIMKKGTQEKDLVRITGKRRQQAGVKGDIPGASVISRYNLPLLTSRGGVSTYMYDG